MKLSIIVTTFRRPRLLQRALHSVFAQHASCPAAIELVVSDDDPDGSALPAIAQVRDAMPAGMPLTYLKRGDGRGGVAESRNRALAAASGSWITFLDDDDALLDGGLAKLLRVARDEGADFCVGGCLRVVEDSEGNELSSAESSPQWQGPDDLLVQNLFPMGSFIVRRDQLQVPFNRTLATHEDWLFLLDNLRDARVAFVAVPVVRISQASGASREHRNVSGGPVQRAADFARIYALHPAPHVAAARMHMLARMGSVEISTLVGGPPRTPESSFHDTAQGRFLVCDPSEPVQAELLRKGYCNPFMSRIAELLVSLDPGAVIEVGAGIGEFAIPVARALPNCTVIACESRRMAFMHLCANALANRLLNLRPVHAAVGVGPEGAALDVPVEDVFARDEDEHGERRAVASERVVIQALDRIRAGEAVALVRVREAERALDILASGQGLLRAQRPTLLLEAPAQPALEGRRAVLLREVIDAGYVVLLLGDTCLAFHPGRLPEDAVLGALAALGLRLAARAA